MNPNFALTISITLAAVVAVNLLQLAWRDGKRTDEVLLSAPPPDVLRWSELIVADQESRGLVIEVGLGRDGKLYWRPQQP